MIEPVPTHIDGERIPASVRVKLLQERQERHAAAFRKRQGCAARTAEEEAADRTAGESPVIV